MNIEESDQLPKKPEEDMDVYERIYYGEFVLDLVDPDDLHEFE